jgi:hypothetical protein
VSQGFRARLTRGDKENKGCVVWEKEFMLYLPQRTDAPMVRLAALIAPLPHWAFSLVTFRGHAERRVPLKRVGKAERPSPLAIKGILLKRIKKGGVAGEMW